jgi:ribosomal protein L7/L12
MNAIDLKTKEECFEILERLHKMGVFVQIDYFPGPNYPDNMFEEMLHIYITNVMMRLNELTFTEEAEKKQLFQIKLLSYGNKKIDVIKTIREFTNTDLKEAKQLTETAPLIIPYNFEAMNVFHFHAALNDAGATSEIVVVRDK